MKRKSVVAWAELDPAGAIYIAYMSRELARAAARTPVIKLVEHDAKRERLIRGLMDAWEEWRDDGCLMNAFCVRGWLRDFHAHEKGTK
jgi:hypothetical protein